MYICRILAGWLYLMVFGTKYGQSLHIVDIIVYLNDYLKVVRMAVYKISEFHSIQFIYDLVWDILLQSLLLRFNPVLLIEIKGSECILIAVKT